MWSLGINRLHKVSEQSTRKTLGLMGRNTWASSSIFCEDISSSGYWYHSMPVRKLLSKNSPPIEVVQKNSFIIDNCYLVRVGRSISVSSNSPISAKSWCGVSSKN